MQANPKPPPMVTLFTGESLSHRDPARGYGRWLGLVLTALLGVSLFIPQSGSWNPFEQFTYAGWSDWLGLRRWWIDLILPATAAAAAIIGTCLPRRPRGVLYVLAGILAAAAWQLFLLVSHLLRPGDSLLTGPYTWAPLIWLFLPAQYLVAGGFDAARRGVGARARAWAPLAPAMLFLGAYAAGFILACVAMDPDVPWSDLRRYLSLTWAGSEIHGVEDWLPTVTTILWAAGLLGSLAIAIVNAFRGSRRLARWGFVCALTFVVLPTFLSPVRQLVGYRTWSRGGSSSTWTAEWQQSQPAAVLRGWLPHACGAALLALGYSTLWPVRRKRQWDEGQPPAVQPAGDAAVVERHDKLMSRA